MVKNDGYSCNSCRFMNKHGLCMLKKVNRGGLPACHHFELKEF